MPYAQSILFRLLAFMRKNILLKHTIDVQYNSVPVSNEPFVQGGKG